MCIEWAAGVYTNSSIKGLCDSEGARFWASGTDLRKESNSGFVRLRLSSCKRVSPARAG